ncbi:DNA double-strand break repair protein Mre11 [Serinicoccus hydrothermalis]|uniref:Nuclease SbcCD subunit D n=2 Tax=Serinicoccus hydrothermalis TaxID=1758689 RepID=A0A1B1NBH1_9MICO|nr:DNA double-strand break repair protein Mre11 [Serinicoccus hydrothermalis]
MVRFLHTADWQIGMTRRFLEPEAQSRFTAARTDAIRRLGEVAAAQDCAFVVVCGDVFESNHLTGRTVRRALDALRTVPVPVYLLPGNHDPLDAASVYRSALFLAERPGHVHVLERAGVHEVSPGVELVAAPWESKHPGRDLVAEAMGLLPPGPAPEGVTRVVVGHGGVDTFDPEWRDHATIATGPLVQALDAGQVHYVALGDRHSRTEVAGRADLQYAGTPEPTRETEVAPGEALVVEVDPGAPSGERVRVRGHRVGTWGFTVLDRQVDSDADVASLDAELAALPDPDRTVVFLNLRGMLGVVEHARLEEVRGRHADRLGALVEREQHRDLVVADDDAAWAELELGGFLGPAVEEIRAEAQRPAPAGSPSAQEAPVETSSAPFLAGRPDDEASARDALALLYRLSRSGS